jgi:hypothetical protein
MKHLKSYKIFESNYIREYKPFYDADVISKCDETIADIKDILLELNDVGYDTNVDYASFVRYYLKYKTPVINIRITRSVGDPEMDAGFRYIPLWDNEEHKREFDEVILRIFHFITSEGYTYEYQDFKTKGQIVTYIIDIYKQ